MLNEDKEDSKENVLNFITSSLYKFASRRDVDQKGLLFLIASLGVLNNSDSPQSIASAKRLAQMAFQRNNK